jgi:hypothetical protein
VGHGRDLSVHRKTGKDLLQAHSRTARCGSGIVFAVSDSMEALGKAERDTSRILVVGVRWMDAIGKTAQHSSSIISARRVVPG